MDKHLKILVSLCLTLFLYSCEKEIEIELDETLPKLVVDGSIENGRPPLIVLNKSLEYFGTLSSDALLQSFVRKADVTISTNGQIFKLIEDSVKVDRNFLYYYTQPLLIGKLNTRYTLTIKTGSQTFTAETTIPSITRSIDSLWWEKVTIEKDSSYARLKMKTTDKPGFGDYIRYFTQQNKDQFFPGLNSVFDDQIIDGRTYTIAVDKGVNKNLPFEEANLYFKRGDTATLKLCNIDKATYDFWRTFEFNFQSIGNPFSSPIKVLGNISGNALGYFGGYAAQYRTLIIPK
ncbi:MAG: DUF4249 domain-containing protein [Sphingobacteriales bacterium]